MELFKSIKDLLRGERHAERIGECPSRGDGCDGSIFHSFPAARERALFDLRGIGVLEKALADERSRDTGGEPTNPVLVESRCLIAAAKTANCLLESKSVPGTRYSVRTGESEVRMVQRDQLYYKIKDPFAKSHLKRHDIRNAIYVDPIIGFKVPARELIDNLIGKVGV